MFVSKIDRRHFLKVLSAGLGATVAAPLLWGAAKPKSASRPDIVLIMADDMGFSDIGCYGGEIQTPNLDALAQGGVRLTQFYNTARCCPTRASLMTGLYPHQAGMGHMEGDQNHPGYTGGLNDRCRTIAEVLRTAGYGTYMSGKWHVTKHTGIWSGDPNRQSKHNWPCQRGFDHFYGTITGAGSFYDPVTLTRDNEPIEPDADKFYYTDAIAENAVTYIQGHHRERRDDPFFCYVAFTAPHWPLHALEEDIDRYKGRYDGGWDALRTTRLERMREMGVVDPGWELSDRIASVQPWTEANDKAWQARRMEVYAAQIDRMDQGIGRIVQALKKMGRLDQTLILFLADNGGCAEELSGGWRGLFIPQKTRDGRDVILGNEHRDQMPGGETTYQSYGRPWANASNTPFRFFKHFVHEGGISSPLIAHWPDRIAGGGKWRKDPAHLIDIMATCVEVSGATYPDKVEGRWIHPMEGKSLMPVFDGRGLKERTLFFEHEGNRAVRRGKWKLVARGRLGPWELYDMEADRTETRDLAERYPDKVREMSDQWYVWAERAHVLPWP